MSSQLSVVRPVAMAVAAALVVAAAPGALAGDDVPGPVTRNIQYSPYPEKRFPNRVYFGDTHLHTSYSADAGMIGCTLGPDEAYRFAKGETVKSSTGQKARLARPLDFLVVADHAENLGLTPLLMAKDPGLMATDFGKALRAQIDAGNPAGAWEIWSKSKAGGKDPLVGQEAIYKTAWSRLTESAEQHNQPGQFTALSATSGPPRPGATTCIAA